MGDFASKSGSLNSRLLNPWVLNFQKLGLELKCPLCLNMFNGPMLLPCNHIFCDTCLPSSAQCSSECPLCKAQFVDRDIRPVPFMGNMVTIYKSLEATFSANLSQLASSGANPSGTLEQCPSFGEVVSKRQSETRRLDFSCREHSVFSSVSHKQVQIPLDRDLSVHKDDKCNAPTDGEGREFEVGVREGESDGVDKSRSLQIEMNQAEQLSAGSPSPFGDSKGSDYSSDEYCDRSSENSIGKRPTLSNCNHDKMVSRHSISISETEGHFRDVKRQKKMNTMQLDLGITNEDNVCSILQSGVSMTSNSELKDISGVLLASEKPPAIVDEVFGITTCAFCQSSKISEDTGPMLHYANGNLAVGNEANLANVIHVHKTCIDWAPQVYYVDETIKNLESEVARGAKLKCSKCGLKGAALGCFMKTCRRSYHFPCAMEISGCRWNCDDFLVLCPSHSSVRFPNEKSKSGKNTALRNQTPLTQKITPQCSSSWAASDGLSNWVFCGSALSSEERSILVKFANMTGATVSKFWRHDVTHVIAAIDENGACTRTFKVLMATLNGRWILKMGWIKACVEATRPVHEEPYEVNLDNYGCSDGPKTGRLRALNNAPKLFKGLRFYFAGDFPLEYKEDLQELVITAGGSVAERREELVVVQNCDENTAPRMVVVYNLESPRGCKVGEEVSILWQRLNEAEGVAAAIGAQVIGHTLLVESIASSNLQAFVN